ncbi:MAG TPA: SpoIID/LytB domain-containing protein [Tepidisphaeraceae bacterium]
MDAFPRGTGVLLVALAMMMLSMSCSPRQSSQSNIDAPQVRVRLLNAVDAAALQIQAPAVLLDESRDTSRKLNLDRGRTVTIRLADDVWQVDGVPAGRGVLVLEPSEAGSVALNGALYRGSYRFVPVAANRFDVVNDVDVESYLKGVLAKELFPDWHAQAYNAQAVIARTYALYEVRSNPSGKHWDLNPDERSQVYGGMKAETDRAREAVDQTRGVVVTHGQQGHERIFKAFFSSCCGGVTASVGDVFGGETIPPLEARYNGTTCARSTRYNWGPIIINKVELTRRAKVWGQKQNHPIKAIPALATIEIATLNSYGRPRRFVVTDTAGQQYSLTGEQMRWAINADSNSGPTVYSSFFRPVDAGTSMQFVEGHGFGHGAGACQWCMQSRALNGESYNGIVLSQFPQSTLLRAY